ncbi:MAG: hypothetical protein KC516_00315 [Nanoarchaeota archaeon]|nr:hypothetical protein [Nanoarchaeota archaeon]
MKNFEDKIHFNGSLDQASKLTSMLKELPDGTFGAIEIEIGSGKYLTIEKIEEDASGDIKLVDMTYHKDKKEIRRIRSPTSVVEYSESSMGRELSFESRGTKYHVVFEE